jgi:hypothetical protein
VSRINGSVSHRRSLTLLQFEFSEAPGRPHDRGQQGLNFLGSDLDELAVVVKRHLILVPLRSLNSFGSFFEPPGDLFQPAESFFKALGEMLVCSAAGVPHQESVSYFPGSHTESGGDVIPLTRLLGFEQLYQDAILVSGHAVPKAHHHLEES